MKEGDICPKCGQGILHKPKVFYSIFDGKKQPDFVCDCGNFYWEHPDPTIPFPTLKITEQKKEKKQELTFEELLKRDEKKREERRRYRRNCRRRKLMETEKSRG